MTPSWRQELLAGLRRVALLSPWHPERDTIRALAALRREQRQPRAELRESMWSALLATCERVRAMPFYQDRMREAGWRGGIPRSFDEFASLALLSATDIQRAGTALLAPGRDPAGLIRMQTSGSSGQPRTIYLDEATAALRLAANRLVDEWAGYRAGCRVALLWGTGAGDPAAAASSPRATPSRATRVLGAIYEPYEALWLPVGDLTPARVVEYQRRLAAFRPDVIVAYAGILEVLARAFTDAGPPHVRPRAVITSAEPLGPHRRRVLEQAFACPVFDRYGTRETGVIAGECSHHTGLHVVAPHVLVEIVADDGRPAPPGAPGRVVVTDLRDTAMPLLRYDLGDIAATIDEPCSCGLTLPRITAVSGRDIDVILCPSGRLIEHVQLTRVLDDQPNIERYRIHQDVPDRVQIRTIAPHLADAARTELETRLRERTGSELAIEIVLVDHLPPTTGGKHPLVDSPVARAALAARR